MDPNLAAMFQRFGTAKPLKERMVFVGPGTHKLALISFGPKNTDKGLIIAWKMLVVESTYHQPGSIVDASVRLYEPELWKREQEESRGAEFVRQLVNPTADPGKLIELSASLAAPHAPGRGLLVVAHGISIPKKAPKPGKDPNFTEVRWEHIPGQTGEQIAAIRAHIERSVPADILNPASAAPPPPAYGYPAAAPPGGYSATPPAQPWPGAAQLPQHPQQHMMGAGYPPAQPPQQPAPAPWGAPPAAPAPQMMQATQPPAWGAQPPIGYPPGVPAAAPAMQPPPAPQMQQPPGYPAPAQPAPAAAPNFLAGILGK